MIGSLVTTGLTLYTPANIYLFKVNHKNSKNVNSQWRRSGVFIVNFEHIFHLSSVSVVDFEQVNISSDLSKDYKKQSRAASFIHFFIKSFAFLLSEGLNF